MKKLFITVVCVVAILISCTPRVKKSSGPDFLLKNNLKGAAAGDFLVDATRFTNDKTLCPDSGSGVILRFGIDENGNSILEENEVINTTFLCDGKTSPLIILKVTEISDGEVCASGSGILIETGYDLNFNEELDPEEVITSNVICDGVDGFNSLIKTSRVAIDKAICESELGVLIETGLDLNRNGVLDLDEVTEQDFICDGSNGKNGAAFLITTVRTSLSKEICASGSGVLVKSGRDLNDNAVLDPEEVENESILCDGANGNDGLTPLFSLEKVDNLDPEVCAGGSGVIISVGFDRNNNKILDPDEIIDSETICDGSGGGSGYNSLISTSRVSISTLICPSGSGLLVQSGLDLNENDILDVDEITDQDFVCDGKDGGADQTVIFRDSFERTDIVTNNSFPWQAIEILDGYNGSNIDAKIRTKSHLGHVIDGDRAVLFRGRDGSSTHEIYTISAPLDLSNFSVVYIQFRYVPLDLESSIILPGISKPVPESIRIDVCNDTDHACGITGDNRVDRLKLEEKWDRFWIQPLEFGDGLNIRQYGKSDWKTGRVYVELSDYPNRKDNFVFKFSAALDEGYKNNNDGNLMDDGIILDDVLVIGIPD